MALTKCPNEEDYHQGVTYQKKKKVLRCKNGASNEVAQWVDWVFLSFLSASQGTKVILCRDLDNANCCPHYPRIRWRNSFLRDRWHENELNMAWVITQINCCQGLVQHNRNMKGKITQEMNINQLHTIKLSANTLSSSSHADLRLSCGSHIFNLAWSIYCGRRFAGVKSYHYFCMMIFSCEFIFRFKTKTQTHKILENVFSENTDGTRWNPRWPNSRCLPLNIWNWEFLSHATDMGIECVFHVK